MHSAETRNANSEAAFSISSERLERGILVAVRGDVDLATAPVVEDELRRAESSGDSVILDLGEVSFMDSTGVRIVIAADQRLRDRGACLRLVRVPPQVVRLLELVGVIDHLKIDDRAVGQAITADSA